jgi:hypothetical protein
VRVRVTMRCSEPERALETSDPSVSLGHTRTAAAAAGWAGQRPTLESAGG